MRSHGVNLNIKMLINAHRAEQLRVAIIEDTHLAAYQVDIAEADLTRGNIYRGVVANIQPSLNAAFIDIGEERHGFLPIGDLLPSTYHRQPPKDEKRPRIDQVLERGRPIVVQVTKDGSGQKGAALTTNIALAGRYLVLMPFDEVRGISRKAADEDMRKKVRERVADLTLPQGQGVIVRTNGIDQNKVTLNRDLNALQRLWRSIRSETSKGRGPRLLYSDQDLIVQALRDYLDNSVEQVIVDSDDAYEKAEGYMQAFMPRSKTRLIRYQERIPLFSRYHLEDQIESIYDRAVPLPSGGSIVIDTTEALTAIDVNSGRATMYGDHEETVLNVNVEAAKETARQLRLRDIGGLVVIDFIDMRLRKNQRKLEKEMRDAMKVDKARYAVGRISPNGLVEINRQRIKQALRLRTHRACPTCSGTGSIANPDFAAMTLLRRIEARAANGLLKSALIALHPEVSDALQNNHRQQLTELEREFDIEIEIIAAGNLSRTEERVDWTQRAKGKAPLPKVAALSAHDLTPKGNRRQTPSDEEENKAADSEASSDAQDGSPPSRKRRRRGGRRRKKAAASGSDQASGKPQQESDGDQPAKGRAAADAKGEETSSASDGGDKQDSSEAPRRTRSRRRRRRGSGSSGQGEESSSQQAADQDAASSADASRDAEPSGKAAASEEKSSQAKGRGEQQQDGEQKGGDQPQGDKPASKSRPRRRRKTSTQDAAPDEKQTSAGDQSAKGAASDEGPAADEPKSRGGRRPRKSTARKSDASGKDDDTAAKAEKDTKAQPKVEGKAGDKPKPRRSSRPSRAKTDDATSSERSTDSSKSASARGGETARADEIPKHWNWLGGVKRDSGSS